MSSDSPDIRLNARDAADEVVLSEAAMSLINAGGKVDAGALREAMDAAGDDSDDAELRRVTFNIKRSPVSLAVQRVHGVPGI